MPSDLPKLDPARHGDTAWTDSHQHTGRTDLPLNERGEQHARQLGGCGTSSSQRRPGVPAAAHRVAPARRQKASHMQA